MSRSFAVRIVVVVLSLAFAPGTRGQGPPVPLSDPLEMTEPLPGPAGPVEAPPPPPAPASSGDPRFFQQRGLVELASGEYDQAIADFDEALRLDPTAPALYYNRSLANFRAHHFERALGDMFEAILRDPQQPDYYLARARVFARMDRFDRARDDYNTVLRAAPLNREALTEREELKVRQAIYEAQHQPEAPTPEPVKAPTRLELALEQAQLEELIARQEKAKLDAEVFRRQRVTPAPPPASPGGQTQAPAPKTGGTDQTLNTEIAVFTALMAKATADQNLYQALIGVLQAQAKAPAGGSGSTP